MADLTSKWNTEEFHFTGWRDRGVHILMGVTLMLEDLEEAQLNLQTMLTMRHVEPFRPKARKLLEQLSNGSESLELWSKVQTLWCSLESVFLGGDIARQVRVGSRTARRGYHSCVMFCCATQMPVVARRFAKIDKDWVRVMAKAYNTGLVVEATSNELLRASLPVMFNELEKCQKNLDSYLEQKRSIFPRFYFVSDPVLLQILSQGSDPQAVQPFYEKIFESITAVEHDDSDNTIIRVRVCARLNVWVCVGGGGARMGVGRQPGLLTSNAVSQEFINKDSAAEERIGFSKPVHATGNIEEWLMRLLQEMQRTMKLLCEECAYDVQVRGLPASRVHC